MPAAGAEAKKTQEEINKNIVRITKLLEMHGRNPAEVKAQKKEELDLIKQEKLLQEKWGDVLEEQKTEMKKQRVGFTSLTSFMGLEAKKYFAETEKNMITWGGLAKSIGTGVKEWFDAASKQNTMLGRTLRLGASLWKGVNDHIIGTVKNIFSTITGQMREVLGEMAGVFDFIKNIFMGMFNFLKDSFKGFFQRVPPHDRQRNKLLQKMVDFMRRAEKRDMLEFMVPDEAFQGLLMPLAMIAAALVGGAIGYFLRPFQAIWKMFRIGNILTSVKNFLMNFKWFGKIMAKFKGVGGLTDKIVEWTGKFMKWFPKFGKVLGKLFGALKWGMKWIGWPITIIFAVIDFIKGFNKTQGTIAEKIIGGLKAAVMGFFELPIKLIGWLIEKLLGLFGVKVDGVADKIIAVFEWIIEAGFGWVKPIVGFIQGFIEGGPMGAIKGFFDGIKSMIKHLISVFPEPVQKLIIGFFQNIGEFFKLVVDKFSGLLKWFGIDFGDEGTGATTTTGKVGTVAHGDFMQMTEAEAKKLEAQQQATSQAIVGAVEKQTQEQKTHNEELAKKQGDNIAVAMSSSGGYQSAPPDTSGNEKISDEVDLGLSVWGNLNASF